MENSGVGIVETHYFTFADGDDKLVLESGVKFGPITIAYETYGKLNSDRSNAILICHALSGDAHAAGLNKEDKRPGWWDEMIGPGRAFDTDQYFVICSNILGGCKGSTGPSSIDPETDKPYGLKFPVVTVGDIVNCQKKLIDHLRIERLFCVSGGSLGGMQAIEWSVSYPDKVENVISIATTVHHTPQQIAFNEVGRQAIMADPNWNNGNYYDGNFPKAGLALARMIGHITYLSDASMHEKFGRRLRGKDVYGFNFSQDFEVESYLQYKGQRFIERFDANSYLYITKALDYYDLTKEGKPLAEVFKDVKARFLIITFSSDWLYPTYQSMEIVRALKANNVSLSYCEIDSRYGHDAFLVESEEQTGFIKSFLKSGSQHRK